MARSRSFKEYVANRYDNEIFNSIATYLVKNKDRLTVNLYNVEYIDWIELQDATVKHVPINDLPGSEIEFDILVEAYFTVRQNSNRYGEREEDATLWFKFSCRGDLEKNLDDVVVADPEEFVYKTYHANPLDDSLVPYIRKNEYDDVATAFLKAAGFDAALTTPTHIDPIKVAEAFGLEVKRVRLSKDHSIFGRLYFCDDVVTYYKKGEDEPSRGRIRGKTILIDPFANYLKNLGQLDNTIIHECFHWFKHKKAYELERLYNEQATSIGCMVVGGVEGDARESTQWMERQANSITPRIQIPDKSLKVHVSNLKRKYRNLGYNDLDMFEPIIDEIAVFYNVSRTAAKIRLIDAGYNEAAGTFNYVDGHYVRPHSWKKDAIAYNQTFTIPEVDAAIQSVTDLRDVVSTGKYEYVESHYVFRSPKYITEDANGNHIMTEYARRHMDECAIAFDLSLLNPEVYGESYHTECFLNKDEHSPFQFGYKYCGEKPLTPEEEEEALERYLMKAQKIANGFTDDFSYCMKESKTLLGLSYNDIADRVNIDERQVRRIFDGESGSLESIVAIIFAMELPPQLSLPLMDRSPHRLMAGKDEHNWIKVAFQTMWGKNLEEVRKKLQEHGVNL